MRQLGFWTSMTILLSCPTIYGTSSSLASTFTTSSTVSIPHSSTSSSLPSSKASTTSISSKVSASISGSSDALSTSSKSTSYSSISSSFSVKTSGTSASLSSRTTASGSTSASSHSSSSVSPSATPQIVSSPLLSTIINAHAWQQYKFQAISCLTSPSLYSGCTEVFQCYGIPDSSSLQYEIATPNYESWDYLFTEVDFYGFSRANYTTIGQVLRNGTAAMMYASCLANSTCNQYLQSYSSSIIQSTLNTYVAATYNEVFNLIPSNGSLTYQPTTAYSNAMSIFTSAASYGSEIYGIHDLVTLMAANGTWSFSALEGMESLGIYLRGGPQIYESMANRLAFYGWECSTNTIGDPSTNPNIKRKRGNSFQDSKHGSSSQETVQYIDKYHDLNVVSTLRGDPRKVLKTMTMDRYLSRYAMIVQPKMLEARACESLANVQNNIATMQSIISTTCGVLGVLGGILDIGDAIDKANNLAQWIPALSFTGNVEFNTLQIVTSFTSTACSLSGVNSICYPDSSVYSFSNIETASTVAGLLKDLVTVTAKGASGNYVGLVVDLGCAAAPIALNAYQHAAQCCQANCESVSCYAASIACGVISSAC